VTGAASPLGRAVVSLLRRRGAQVTGMVRRLNGVTTMRRLGAEPHVGDLSRTEGMLKAMQGCDVVFHVAGFFDFWARNPATFEAVNVEGTKHVLAAAILAKVPRVVFSSSALTIGEAPGDEGHEWTQHRGYTLSEFERTKLAAERAAQKLRGRGLQVVTVNPSLIVSPADTGWTGRLLRDAVVGRQRFVTDAPLSWVWVEDAALGMLHAYERGKDGERYVLSGDVVPMRRFLARVARLAGRSAPSRAPAWLAAGGAKLTSVISESLGRRPALPADEQRFLQAGLRVDGAYAVQQLGIEYTPIDTYLPHVVKSYRMAAERFGD
jgi:dihydroflavonol-4-reductase